MSYDKKILLKNIYNLSKEKDLPISSLEMDAGVSQGYISRLNRPSNTSNPGIDVVASIAQSLSVSIDFLISYDPDNHTGTENYMISFLNKLLNDTKCDKLDWKIETPHDLSKNANNHPLYSFESFYRQSECEYPDYIEDDVFVSKSFGCNTSIDGDCFNIRLKNGLKIYIMKISKDVYKLVDKTAHAVEIWMVQPGEEKKFVCSTKDDCVFAELTRNLYQAATISSKHPKINKNIMHSIDAFMNDDLTDDDDDLPF